MFELKRLSPSAIPAALAKAERYRLLNEPQQSQSICEDVLRADPDNHQALVTLILSLSDEFPHHHARTVARAQELVARLPSEYERHYYGGLVAERRAHALLGHGVGEEGVVAREARTPGGRQLACGGPERAGRVGRRAASRDRKSTRLNSSH